MIMKLRELFLELTKRTYPHGTEDDLLEYLPSGIKKDPWGNYYIKIGNSPIIFSAHLDTYSKEVLDIKHKIRGNIISTYGDTILGGDDKSGVTILIYMIHMGVEGMYYFFCGEEVGCIGSKAVCENVDLSSYTSIISLDRRGYSSVVTHQSQIRTSSDEFSRLLVDELSSGGLNYKLDEGGIWSDSAIFSKVISECTNISVGYQDEHTPRESQDIDFLSKLAIAISKINFNKLIPYRDPTRVLWQGSYLPEGSGYRNKGKIMKKTKKEKVEKPKDDTQKKEPTKLADPFSYIKKNLLGF